jgi:hypothetical protein
VVLQLNSLSLSLSSKIVSCENNYCACSSFIFTRQMTKRGRPRTSST